MEKAVIYARYSSEKQTEQSIEGQLHVCTEYAEKNNFKIVNTYIDRAKSGRTDNRQAFQQMLKDSTSKRFSAVIVYALDRFSRNRYDSAIHKANLKKNGVRLISATQPISESPEGILLESLLEGLAEYYSVELAQKLARGRRESIAKGQFTGGTVTYGYKIIDKKYVIQEDEAKTVRLIFDLFLKYRNYHLVLRHLKENCIYGRNNIEFKKTSLFNLLRNKKYIGTLECGEFVCENATPPIVADEIFKEAQNIMKGIYVTHSKSPANFLLTGKLVCGECGANLIGDSSVGRKNKIYYYYSCQSKKAKKECDLPRISKDNLENLIYEESIKELKTEQFSNTIINDLGKAIDEENISKNLSKLKNELQGIEKSLDNISKAVQNGIINEKIKNQNEELIERKEYLKAQIEEIENDPFYNISPITIKNCMINEFANANIENVLNSLVYKVYVYKKKIVIIFTIKDNNNPKYRHKAEIDAEIDTLVHRLNGYPHQIFMKNNAVFYYFEINQFNKS